MFLFIFIISKISYSYYLIETPKQRVEVKELSKKKVKLVEGKDVSQEPTPQSTPKRKSRGSDEPKFKDEYAKEAYKVRYLVNKF